MLDHPLSKHVRIARFDACTLMRCLADSVAVHSFVGARNTTEAKGSARTLFIDRCNCASVLILHGLCFSSNNVCFGASRVLENMVWNLSNMERPYLVYKEGDVGIGGGEPVLNWFEDWCAYRELCQCHLVGRTSRGGVRFPEQQVWHHPSTIYSNMVSRRHQFFEVSCRHVRANMPYPRDCNRKTMNSHIAINPSGIAVHVLSDAPPSVPPRRAPSMSILKCERKHNEERNRYVNWRIRRAMPVWGHEYRSGALTIFLKMVMVFLRYRLTSGALRGTGHR